MYNVFVVPLDVMILQQTDGCDARCWIEYTLDLFFLVDILINFRTAYFDEDSDCRHRRLQTSQARDMAGVSSD